MSFFIKEYNAAIIEVESNPGSLVALQFLPEAHILSYTVNYQHRLLIHLIIYI